MRRFVSFLVILTTVFLAHLAFVAMLANCLRKPELVATKGDGRENILDDVIL